MLNMMIIALFNQYGYKTILRICDFAALDCQIEFLGGGVHLIKSFPQPKC